MRNQSQSLKATKLKEHSIGEPATRLTGTVTSAEKASLTKPSIVKPNLTKYNMAMGPKDNLDENLQQFCKSAIQRGNPYLKNNNISKDNLDAGNSLVSDHERSLNRPSTQAKNLNKSSSMIQYTRMAPSLMAQEVKQKTQNLNRHMKRRSAKVGSQHKFSKGTDKDLVVQDHSQSMLSNTFILVNEGQAPPNASVKRAMARSNTATRARKVNIHASFLQHTTASRQKLQNKTKQNIPFGDSEENFASEKRMEKRHSSSNCFSRSCGKHNFNANTKSQCGQTPKANFQLNSHFLQSQNYEIFQQKVKQLMHSNSLHHPVHQTPKPTTKKGTNVHRKKTASAGNARSKQAVRLNIHQLQQQSQDQSMQDARKLMAQNRSQYLNHHFNDARVTQMAQAYFKAAEQEIMMKKGSNITIVEPGEYQSARSKGQVLTHTKANDRFINEELRPNLKSDETIGSKHNSSTSNKWSNNYINSLEELNQVEIEKKIWRKELGDDYLKKSLKASKKNSRKASKNISPMNQHDDEIRLFDSAQSHYGLDTGDIRIPGEFLLTQQPQASKSQILKISEDQITLKNEKEIQPDVQRKLQFLYQNLGAVCKGYKTRRIYHNNKAVKKIRSEFRDLIQFAYSLKLEIQNLQTQQRAPHGQVEQLNNMLMTSLKDVVNKRQQFANQIQYLHDSGFRAQVFGQAFRNQNKASNIEWISQSKPKDIQNSLRVSLNMKTIKSIENQKEVRSSSSSNDLARAEKNNKSKSKSQYRKQFINANKEQTVKKKCSTNAPSKKVLSPIQSLQQTTEESARQAHHFNASIGLNALGRRDSQSDQKSSHQSRSLLKSPAVTSANKTKQQNQVQERLSKDLSKYDLEAAKNSVHSLEKSRSMKIQTRRKSSPPKTHTSSKDSLPKSKHRNQHQLTFGFNSKVQSRQPSIPNALSAQLSNAMQSIQQHDRELPLLLLEHPLLTANDYAEYTREQSLINELIEPSNDNKQIDIPKLLTQAIERRNSSPVLTQKQTGQRREEYQVLHAQIYDPEEDKVSLPGQQNHQEEKRQGTVETIVDYRHIQGKDNQAKDYQVSAQKQNQAQYTNADLELANEDPTATPLKSFAEGSASPIKTDYQSPYRYVPSSGREGSQPRRVSKNFRQANKDRIKQLQEERRILLQSASNEKGKYSSRMSSKRLCTESTPVEATEKSLETRVAPTEAESSVEPKPFVSKIPRLGSSNTGQASSQQQLTSAGRQTPQKQVYKVQSKVKAYINQCSQDRIQSQKLVEENQGEISEQIRLSNEKYVKNVLKVSDYNSNNRSNFSHSSQKSSQYNKQTEKFASSFTRSKCDAEKKPADQNPYVSGVSDSTNPNVASTVLSSLNKQRTTGKTSSINHRYDHQRTFSNVSDMSKLLNDEQIQNNNDIAEQIVKEVRKAEEEESFSLEKRRPSSSPSPQRCRQPSPYQKEGEGKPQCSPARSEGSSDASPATQLKKILERFSPMKEVNFTNKYIEKRRAIVDEEETSLIIENLKSRSRERRATQKADVVAACHKLETAKQSIQHSEISVNKIAQSPEKPQYTLDAEVDSQKQQTAFKQYEDNYDNEYAQAENHITLNDRITHHLSKDIDIFDQSRKYLNPSMSSNFDSKQDTQVMNSQVFSQNRPQDVQHHKRMGSITDIDQEIKSLKESIGLDHLQQRTIRQRNNGSLTDQIPQCQDDGSSFRLCPHSIQSGTSQTMSAFNNISNKTSIQNQAALKQAVYSPIPSIMNPCCSESPTQTNVATMRGLVGCATQQTSAALTAKQGAGGGQESPIHAHIQQISTPISRRTSKASPGKASPNKENKNITKAQFCIDLSGAAKRRNEDAHPLVSQSQASNANGRRRSRRDRSGNKATGNRLTKSTTKIAPGQPFVMEPNGAPQRQGMVTRFDDDAAMPGFDKLTQLYMDGSNAKSKKNFQSQSANLLQTPASSKAAGSLTPSQKIVSDDYRHQTPEQMIIRPDCESAKKHETFKPYMPSFYQRLSTNKRCESRSQSSELKPVLHGRKASYASVHKQSAQPAHSGAASPIGRQEYGYTSQSVNDGYSISNDNMSATLNQIQAAVNQLQMQQARVSQSSTHSNGTNINKMIMSLQEQVAKMNQLMLQK